MTLITELKLKAHIDPDRGLLYGYIEDLTTGEPYIFDSSLDLLECLRKAVDLEPFSLRCILHLAIVHATYRWRRHIRMTFGRDFFRL